MAQLFKEGKHARLCEYHNYCFVNGILGRHMLILAVIKVIHVNVPLQMPSVIDMSSIAISPV